MARQPDSAPKGAGVKALSSRLLQMKFMKRGQAAETPPHAASASAAATEEEPTDASEQPKKVSEDERWVARTPQSGCIIISEPDPPPGALLGHMTFGGFNPAIEQMQKEAETRLREAKRKRAGGSDSVQQQAGATDYMQQAAVQSLRMQKRTKQPKR
ncbi:hypothetical protein CVIRNUC_002557 [Coccomyxa viridis]|uniref:Uncharacterized protein n=1 Tax=Coccomyxa viridis TaxID=1274662 RepID=A0AAV1HZ55_9CHLO|nr:hypothetical protein CVIRNUC_002557 [Coccomyxa viridis]